MGIYDTIIIPEHNEASGTEIREYVMQTKSLGCNMDTYRLHGGQLLLLSGGEGETEGIWHQSRHTGEVRVRFTVGEDGVPDGNGTGGEQTWVGLFVHGKIVDFVVL